MTQVLVVDDSLSVRKALETILRPLQYTVRMADSGEAALGALSQSPADLVIADVLMPGLSGFELCQQIKASSEHGATPVVLISGIVSEEEVAHARSVGAVGMVKKPFRADDLLPIVQSALRAAQGAPAAPTGSIPATAGARTVSGVGELLDTLLGKQGIQGALVLDGGGSVVVTRGDSMPGDETLGQYLRFFVSTAGVFGKKLGDEWQSVLMEYSGRTLLLFPLPGGYALTVILRDAGASTVAKFVVKGQRAQFESALRLN